MNQIIALAADNLISPMILSFVLGLAAALSRSDLSIPDAIAKGLSIYLLFAIGFKGGASVAEHGVDASLVFALLAGVALSFSMPFIAFGMLKVLTQLSTTDAAAVAGHYGSISIVTFVTATSLLEGQNLAYEGYMVAVAASMEAPAILAALWLIMRSGKKANIDPGLWRDILVNGSIVLLFGSFAIGWITGEEGLAEIEAFVVSPFKGALCLFLLDMGLVAGRSLRNSRGVIGGRVVAFGFLMPLIGAGVGLLAALALGLSPGGAFLLAVLCASASYIAVPAAMRVAVPEANPAIYLTLSLGVTFPFNLTLGIPLYLAVTMALVGP